MHIDEERHADGTLKRLGQDYYLKPMNCPMHCLIFRSRRMLIGSMDVIDASNWSATRPVVRVGMAPAASWGMTQDDAHIYGRR